MSKAFFIELDDLGVHVDKVVRIGAQHFGQVDYAADANRAVGVAPGVLDRDVVAWMPDAVARQALACVGMSPSRCLNHQTSIRGVTPRRTSCSIQQWMRPSARISRPERADSIDLHFQGMFSGLGACRFIGAGWTDGLLTGRRGFRGQFPAVLRRGFVCGWGFPV